MPADAVERLSQPPGGGRVGSCRTALQARCRTDVDIRSTNGAFLSTRGSRWRSTFGLSTALRKWRPIVRRLTTAATVGLVAARRKWALELQQAPPPTRPTESGLIRPNPTQSDPTQYDLIRVDPTESDRVKPVSDCKCTMSGAAIWIVFQNEAK